MSLRRPKVAPLQRSPTPAPGRVPRWVVAALERPRQEVADLIGDVRFQPGLVDSEPYASAVSRVVAAALAGVGAPGHRFYGRPELAADALVGLFPGLVDRLGQLRFRWLEAAIERLPKRRRAAIAASRAGEGLLLGSHLGGRPSTRGFLAAEVDVLRQLPTPGGRRLTRAEAIAAVARMNGLSVEAVESAVDRENRRRRKAGER